MRWGSSAFINRVLSSVEFHGPTVSIVRLVGFIQPPRAPGDRAIGTRIVIRGSFLG